MNLVDPDPHAAPPPVSPERVARQRELAAWHAEWSARQIAAGVDGPVPPDRKDPSDYNLHVPDLDASAAAQDQFHRRARVIMGLPPQ